MIIINPELFSKYCTLIFIPEQIEVQLNNYYKLSQN